MKTRIRFWLEVEIPEPVVCADCGSDIQIDLHHLRYTIKANELSIPISVLIKPLCRKCHEKIPTRNRHAKASDSVDVGTFDFLKRPKVRISDTIVGYDYQTGKPITRKVFTEIAGNIASS